MTKSITLIGINFFPEDTAIGLYTTQMAVFLRRKGYKINILTGFPYYPQWKIKDNYKNKPAFYKEIINNITVYRYKQYVPQKPTFFKRIIHLTDFTLGSLVNGLKIKQSDLIIAVVPFTSTIFLGWLLKKRLKAKLWAHIQDFEFDAAKQTGVSRHKNNILFTLLFKIEKYLLCKTDMASTISKPMLAKLKTKTKGKTIYFPNWINQEKSRQETSIKHPLLKSTAFKVLYSGNIGAKQDWQIFIDFLNKIKRYQNVEVHIVGDGAKKEWLLQEIKSFAFVKMHNPVPLNALKSLLSSADLHILFQKDDVLDTVMPSKILGMMMSGRPSLITGHLESEVSRIISESGGGIYLSNNIQQVLEAFEKLYSNNDIRIEMGIKAKEFVSKHYAYDKILSNFEKEIQVLLNTGD